MRCQNPNLEMPLYDIILYYVLFYYIVLYYTLLYSTLLYSTLYYILYTIYYILYTIYYILYTIYYILYTKYYILYWQELPSSQDVPILVTSCYAANKKAYPKAPCSCMVYTWALQGLPCHDFRAYAYTIWEFPKRGRPKIEPNIPRPLL